MQRPSMVISPLSGVKNPAIRLRVVLFPHPEGPSIATHSPCSTSREKSKTAHVSPKDLLSPLRLRKAIDLLPLHLSVPSVHPCWQVVADHSPVEFDEVAHLLGSIRYPCCNFWLKLHMSISRSVHDTL